MAGLDRREAGASGPTGSAGPRRPKRRRRQQELQGKQQPAPRQGQRSKEKRKVNCKPRNQDGQEIPFRLREIMRARQQMKNPVSNKRKKRDAQVVFRKTLEKEAKGPESDIAVPRFKQRKRESDRAYIQRMEQAAQHVLFLSRNQATRQPEAQEAPRREKSERKRAFQKRRQDKARQRKEDKVADRLERELLRDTIKFGEVALQPPDLAARPRKSLVRGQPDRKALLLKTLLGPGCVSQPPKPSLARQRIVEEERERVVQAYRTLKKLKQQPGPRSAHLLPWKKPAAGL
ncbi:coiled-coil domain-containing protein 137 [Orycteropus afer afer]|uniref:Coiled-coil domain-containing protein 137 n=1 Tax=Orycteropus afer afer TaxID=1230840 RepID=A0A8B7BE68_ORYAF|nr:coiled-coil domain-containing protein 137 [Orycteropus afer afer]